MKYKVIKYFFFVVLVGIGTACSDMLDNEIDTNLRPEQVYVNYDRMKQVAVGAYTNLQVIGGFTSGKLLSRHVLLTKPKKLIIALSHRNSIWVYGISIPIPKTCTPNYMLLYASAIYSLKIR